MDASYCKSGGYCQLDVNGEFIRELANWAVSEAKKEGRGSFKLIEIISAEKQVVAGINRSLMLKLAEEEAPNKMEVYAVAVFEDLQGGKQLIGFSKV